MSDEKTWLSCREASKLLGVSQRHVLNLIYDGKIVAYREKKDYHIPKEEFYRDYPAALNKDLKHHSDSMLLLQVKLKHLEAILDEKNKLNDFLTEQIENFNEEKSKMLDTNNTLTKILETKEKFLLPNKDSEKKKIDGEKQDWIPEKD